MPKPKVRTLGKLTELTITEKQYADIASCTSGRGGTQNLYRRLHSAVKVRDGRLILPVYDTDLEGLKKEARRVKTGTWQDTARDVLQSNGLSWEL